MIVVAGEALIDLVPSPAGDGHLLPLPGGSPYNVAVGLGRLGVPTSYLGALSGDGFGTQLARGLRDAGVSLGHVVETALPTTLAVVHLDPAGQASYGFYVEGTSVGGLPPERVPRLDDRSFLLHLSLGAVTLETPSGAGLRHLLQRERGQRLRSLDPNVRPAVIDDVARYRETLEEAVRGCDLVRVSDEDLRILYPDESAEAVAARWAAEGPLLTVLTQGAAGAVAFGPAGRVAVASPAVEVVDTVGAGDAFTGGLLARLHHLEVRTATDLQRLSREDLSAVLHFATRVAAVTCTRRGANPPTLAEVPDGG